MVMVRDPGVHRLGFWMSTYEAPKRLMVRVQEQLAFGSFSGTVWMRAVEGRVAI